MRRFILALLLVIALSAPSFAQDGDLFSVETDEGQEVRIDNNGLFIGAKANYEKIATNETVTAADSGKTYVVRLATDNTTDTITFTLPSAAVGLQYTFVVADDETVYIDPTSSDTIKYLASMTTGDKLTSPGATGDSVTLISAAANTWYVIPLSGSWTDGD